MWAVRVEPRPCNELLLFSPATIAVKCRRPGDTRTVIVTTPGGNGNEVHTDGFDGPHPDTAFGDTIVVRACAAGAATAARAMHKPVRRTPRGVARAAMTLLPFGF